MNWIKIPVIENYNISSRARGSSSTVTEINSMELNVPVNIQTPWHAVYDFTFEAVSSQKNYLPKITNVSLHLNDKKINESSNIEYFKDCFNVKHPLILSCLQNPVVTFIFTIQFDNNTWWPTWKNDELLVKVNYKTLLFSKNLELALNRQDFGIPTGPMMLYNQNGIEYKSLHTPIMIEQESQTTDEE